MIFDTLAYANKLKAVGVSEEQAEVQAETIAELFSENLVTKDDLQKYEHWITIKLGGTMICSFSLLVVLIKLFHL